HVQARHDGSQGEGSGRRCPPLQAAAAIPPAAATQPAPPVSAAGLVTMWSCDVCRVAQFASFDAAVEHEKSCDRNPPIPAYDADPPAADANDTSNAADAECANGAADPPPKDANDTSNAADAECAYGAAKRQKVSMVESAPTSNVLGRIDVLGHLAAPF
ncbi:hypothetical protein THAOC_13620, partial [Thalassiosira oceanica]